MIEVRNEAGVAVVAPDGHYEQAQFVDAIDRVFTLFPDGCARILVMDFSRAHGVERHSIVRIRETARHIASHGPRYGWRVAVVAPVDGVVDVMNIGGVVARGQGVEYRFCRDIAEAHAWAGTA